MKKYIEAFQLLALRTCSDRLDPCRLMHFTGKDYGEIVMWKDEISEADKTLRSDLVGK